MASTVPVWSREGDGGHIGRVWLVIAMTDRDQAMRPMNDLTVPDR